MGVIWRAGTLPTSPTLASPGAAIIVPLVLESGVDSSNQSSGQFFVTRKPGAGSKAGTLDYFISPMVQGGSTIIPPKNNRRKQLAVVSRSLITDTFKKHSNCPAPFS